MPSQGACSTRPVTLYVHLRPDGTLELEGHGFLTRDTVADLLAGAHVTVRPVIDLNSRIVSTGYQPSHRLREQTLLVKDTCFFAYCDVPARRCDYEHTVAAPRGTTGTGNAGHACRHHHHIKTSGDWDVRQPFRGIYVWRSPIGDVYAVDAAGTHSVTRAD
jgi:hypothetical protein